MAEPSRSLFPTIAPTPASAAGFLELVDPSTGDVIARFLTTSPSAGPELIERARKAQRSWAAATMAHRCECLRRMRDVIFEHRREIAEVIMRETGKPMVEAIYAEILLTLDTLNFFARKAPWWLRPRHVWHHNIAVKAKSGKIEFAPWGVVAVIAPWNYPLAIPMSQIAPALVAGNAVVLKPSELAPWVGSLIGDFAARAGIPDGLLQVAQGGPELGAAIVDCGPDKVFFTGSVTAGKRVAEMCAAKLIPSVLELGGKDAMIVLADADLKAASSAAVWGAFTNCGQACLSVERVYVERAIADEFVRLCVAKTQELHVGQPFDADVEMGPVKDPWQLDKIERYLRDAIERGANIVTGGKRRLDLGSNFFEPTVVTNVNHTMLLMKEEVFGPVLAIQSVDSVDEAIGLANDSEFALSGSVWTKNSRRGERIASRLRAGSVMVNDVASYYGISEAPHGGVRASGWGRTHGRLGLLEMVRPKYIDVDLLPRLPKPWWFGYDSTIADAADRFIEMLFAPNWKDRIKTLMDKHGALKALFRDHRI